MFSLSFKSARTGRRSPAVMVRGGGVEGAGLQGEVVGLREGACCGIDAADVGSVEEISPNAAEGEVADIDHLFGGVDQDGAGVPEVVTGGVCINQHVAAVDVLVGRGERELVHFPLYPVHQKECSVGRGEESNAFQVVGSTSLNQYPHPIFTARRVGNANPDYLAVLNAHDQLVLCFVDGHVHGVA